MGELFLERYEAEREVGQGGMAVVYRGTDRVLHRPVAIKVLHTHLSQKAEARARFAREARVIAKLRHPNVVEVYDFAGEESERAFIVAEFVEGHTLADFLHEHGPVHPEIAACVTATVARALHHAHERGVIHRDVKPENIMVRRDGVLKLMDFGIAHVVDMEHLTVTGAIIGSPAHMSPEQVDGRALDARTDVFSLGTLFFLMASGRYPFVSDTASGLLKSIVEARVPDIRAVCPTFPDELHAVLKRMMARNPDDRYQTAAEAAIALDEAVAAVGLAGGDGEVARFFADPEGRTAEARALVTAARLERAKERLRRGKPAAAIRELNVAIANSPGDEEAVRWLARTRRSARRREVSRSVLVAAGGLAAVAVVAVLAIRLLPDTGETAEEVPSAAVPAPAVEPRAAAAPVQIEPGQAAPAPAGEAAVPRPRLPPETVPAGRPAKPPRVAAVAAPVPAGNGPPLVAVVIQANPPAVRITLDGRVAGEGTTGELRLPPGRHVVRLTHPSCAACQDAEYGFTIDPANPPVGPLRYSIGYRDASLTVSGPAGALVAVNGVARGRTNERLAIPMTGPQPLVATVSVQAEGRPPRTSRVTLEAGKQSILELP
jgi:serine/threonine-protein kinase